MVLFGRFRLALFEWKAFHADPPMANGEFDAGLSAYGISKLVDPWDGDFARYRAEPASRSEMWPWMAYVREEPDWDVIGGHTGLVRAMRAVRKALPWSRWYGADELGVGSIMTFTDDGFRPIVRK